MSNISVSAAFESSHDEIFHTSMEVACRRRLRFRSARRGGARVQPYKPHGLLSSTCNGCVTASSFSVRCALPFCFFSQLRGRCRASAPTARKSATPPCRRRLRRSRSFSRSLFSGRATKNSRFFFPRPLFFLAGRLSRLSCILQNPLYALLRVLFVDHEGSGACSPSTRRNYVQQPRPVALIELESLTTARPPPAVEQYLLFVTPGCDRWSSPTTASAL